jgi:serine/threonine protein kinase
MSARGLPTVCGAVSLASRRLARLSPSESAGLGRAAAVELLVRRCRMSTTNITPGIIVVPLNLPGPEYAGLTTTYDFEELLGAGGFGEAWRTRIRGTGEWHERAIKVSFEPVDSNRVRLALHGTMAVAAQLPHPHLCSVGSVSWGGERLWVTSELAEGNMAGLAGGVARLPELLRYAREAAAGLDHLHGCGLVHNRVKPSNILIVNGSARVGDFDLVHPLRPDVGSGWVVRYGDPNSLAPEILAGRLCPGSDQFALACAYAAVRLGRPAFPGGVMRGRPALGALPAAERAVLLQALAVDPERRFPSCQAFADALAASAEPAAAADRGGM